MQIFHKVAIHTSTHLCKMSISDMRDLVQNSITDAFIPKMLIVTQTPERANEVCQVAATDPYWEANYRDIAKARIGEKFGGILPICTQYQRDTKTLVSCLKVEYPVSFEPICHFETDRPIRDPKDFQPADIFFALQSEDHYPIIKTWDDIKWDQINVISNEIFHRFIQILLRRLRVILSDLWKSKDNGYTAVHGDAQEITKDTYLDYVVEHLQREQQ